MITYRLRDGYRTGPGSFTFEYKSGEKVRTVTVEVDKDGFFDCDASPAEVPLGVFSKVAARTKST